LKWPFMNFTNINTLSLGVCDYPEHVDKSQWAIHAREQRKLGLSIVRLGEFSWAKIEPVDGHYDWLWLDEAIAIYEAEGLKIVLGTPTATPPAWLVQKLPEILPVDASGSQMNFGSRRHYDHASLVYREECGRIVKQMAGRYGNHPAVVGWQTDNELGHEGTAVSYGGASASAFPAWLEKKYADLKTLNEAWGTVFWSQDYSDWSQIRPPNQTAVNQPNPSQVLDYQRFCSDMIIEFQQLQIDLLRELSPGRFITHNFVIFAAEFDLYKASKQLDFVAWDSYPIGMLEYFATWESEEVKTRFARTGHPDLVSLNHDIYRGLKNGTDFWVMEQQCGHANWAQYNPLPATGAVQLWTAQAWAHGASAVIYFRWRSSHMAQEIMHSGLLQQDGRADRGIAEVQSFDPGDFALEAIPAQVALLHDYNSMWIYDQQAHNQDLNYWHQFVQYYSALRSLGVDVDVINPHQLDPQKYKVVVAPALTLMTQEIAEKLEETAKHCPVILGPRSAFRTDSGRVPENGQFAQIEQLVGIKLGNFDSLRPTLEQSIKTVDGNECHTARLWCESYEPVTANTVYKYSDGPLDGLSAVTEHQQVTVIGALSATLTKQILRQTLLKQNIEICELPEGVRISRRGKCKLLVNFNQQEVSWQGVKIPAVSSVKFEV
jgi:beta-galactosidase